MTKVQMSLRKSLNPYATLILFPIYYYFKHNESESNSYDKSKLLLCNFCCSNVKHAKNDAIK